MDREVVGESRLDSVTVYASGALCRRRVVFTPAGDVTRLRLPGLPLALDAHSLRARVLGALAGLRVTDARREIRAEVVPGERLATLQRELDVAEETHDAARARRDRIAARVDATAALRAVPPTPRRGDPPRPAPVDALLALAAFVDERLTALHARLLAAEDALALAEHVHDTARHRLGEASHALPTESTRTTVDAVVTITRGELPLSQETGAETELELEYVVPGATWFPAYQLSLAQDTGTGGLALRANIAQRTGEDWTGVRLSLSTADLQRRAALPELRSIRLGRRQDEAPVPQWREPPAGLSELFDGYDSASPRRPLSVRPGGALAAGKAVAVPAVAMAYEPQAASAPAPVLRRAAARRGAGQEPVRAQYTAAGAGAFTPAVPQAPGGPPPPAAHGAALSVFAPTPEPTLDPALSDYADLVLAGPDAEQGDARGTLAPDAGGPAGRSPIEAEYRRRALAVNALTAPPHAVPVSRASTSFAYRFDTAAPVDVPADGVWHSVPVDDFPVGLTPQHLCVPALDPQVYAAVELTNTSPHPLLPGPVDVLVDGQYTATVPMPSLAPGESRRIGIGVEEGVRVARRSRTSESTTGLRAGTSVVARSVEIDVVNRLGRAVSLELLERVPVSDEKDVRVEDTAATPPWTVVPPEEDEERRRGLRRWRIVVPPGGTAALRAGYELRLPADKAVLGGNRRDA
ncbi:hypothetical protein ABIA32_002008 [Streptacidiphilus sp. MAP12-20]|uniref:DUF4139 domain-containing protein n=1 Tax=Streptacidiphilus sp. MAP12-20 TaxID=3156299 RepID=UPI003513ED6E